MEVEVGKECHSDRRDKHT